MKNYRYYITLASDPATGNARANQSGTATGYHTDYTHGVITFVHGKERTRSFGLRSIVSMEIISVPAPESAQDTAAV